MSTAMLTHEDQDTVKRVWSGQIPVCFKLADQDCSSIETPDSFFIMLPRISYLPFTWEKVQRYFSSYVAEEHRSSQLWFETPVDPESPLSGSTILRWQLPIGLLYDLHGGGTLPWTIIVHFRDFPDKELIACETKQVAEAHFMNSVKEADFLKTRKKVMTAMPQSERRQMTSALYSLQVETFWFVNRKLMFTSESWKHVPLRVFLIQSPPSTAISAGGRPIVQQVQKLVPMSGPNGVLPDDSNQLLTLRYVLRQWLKRDQSDGQATPSTTAQPTKRLDKGGDTNQSSGVQEDAQASGAQDPPNRDSHTDSSGVEDGAEAATTGAIKTTEQSTADEGNSKGSTLKEDRWEEDEMEVILHGIPAPLDIPLHWLAINMSYADNFLYVVVRQRKEKRLS